MIKNCLLLTLFTFLCWAQQSMAATIIPGGNVSGTWDGSGSPYVVEGDITIPVGSSLAISTGALAQVSNFDPTGSGQNPSKVEILVNGALNILDADVVAQNGNPASWGGITANAGSTVNLSNAFIQGDLTLNTGSDYLVNILNATNFDNAKVNGNVSLSGNLVLNAGSLTASAGDSFMLLMNDGSNPISGTFSGLSEGAALSLGGINFNLSYIGGDGNDLVLSSVPIPAAVWLFGFGLISLAGIARKKRL